VHELAITQNMLDLTLEQARKAQAKQVTKINLVIGEMSGVVDDCVEFYFSILRQDTIAREAILSFKRIPIQLRCRRCAIVFSPSEPPWACPNCRQWDAEVVAGRELYIDSIEVE
jgi:hydrogenase nickel incorporation protein HypA/HybF